jgi:hypothetical protein
MHIPLITTISIKQPAVPAIFRATWLALALTIVIGNMACLTAQAAVIYRETFGIAPGATVDSFATVFDWQRFDNNGAEITTAGTSSGVNYTVAGRPVDVANVNAGPNNDGTFDPYVNGILYLAATPSPNIAMTTEYSFNPADYAPGSVVFSWYEGNNTAPHTFRMLVRVGGRWYASATVFTTPAVSLANFGTQSQLKTLTYNPGRTNWQVVNFDGDYVVGATPGSGTTTDSTLGPLSLAENPASDLSGAITGFGVYGTDGGSATGNRRIDSFTIEATPAATGGSGWRLIGITGQQGDDTRNAQNEFLYPDNTLFEINLANGALTKLFRTTWVPDSHSIGYSPANNLVYHSAGAGAYRDDPLRAGHEQGGPDIPGLGFQDNYYLETINLATRAMSPILNANPCPNPDAALPCFGLPAPVPKWALPDYRRKSSQIESTNRLRGTNEYSALRGMAWSTAKNLFYVTDSEGIFKLTPSGDSTFLARPAFPIDSKRDVAKGIAFVTVTNVTKLLVGHRDGSGENGYMMEIDPENGNVLAELAVTYPPGGGEPAGEFGGLLGLAQHPVTQVLYGIRKTEDNFARELVTINPATGATTLVGNMGMHMADIVFVSTASAVQMQIQSITRNGATLTLSWTGGAPPYQVQKRSSLTGGAWSNDSSAVITGTSAAVTLTGNEGYYRVQGQ